MEDEADLELLNRDDDKAGGAGDGDDETRVGDEGEDGGEQGAGEAATGEGGSAEDEVVVSIGDEQTADDAGDNRAPEWVRELRKTSREKDRRIRELEQELRVAKPAEKAIELGAKPTLEGCDFDSDKFEQELEAWHQKKRQADDRAAEQRRSEEAAQAAWQAKLDAYGRAKGELKVKDYDDAEALAQESLSVTQQGVILQGAENPALVIYALGKNPTKAKDLGSITDPVKFAFAVAKLETQLKVTPRKTAPLPEKTVSGSAPVSGTVDSTLERLRAEADKTGNYTKVHQYRQQQRAKQR